MIVPKSIKSVFSIPTNFFVRSLTTLQGKFEVDYYSKLCLPKTATSEEIKKSYKQLALKLHPDRNQQNPNASEEFRLVTEAYKVLSSPEKRSHYDSVMEFYSKPPPLVRKEKNLPGTYREGPAPYGRIPKKKPDFKNAPDMSPITPAEAQKIFEQLFGMDIFAIERKSVADVRAKAAKTKGVFSRDGMELSSVMENIISDVGELEKKIKNKQVSVNVQSKKIVTRKDGKRVEITKKQVLNIRGEIEEKTTETVLGTGGMLKGTQGVVKPPVVGDPRLNDLESLQKLYDSVTSDIEKYRYKQLSSNREPTLSIEPTANSTKQTVLRGSRPPPQLTASSQKASNSLMNIAKSVPDRVLDFRDEAVSFASKVYKYFMGSKKK